jgi:HKD family nuclease
MNITVLFDAPQKEIASLIRSKLSQCDTASIVTGFMTPSGIGSISGPIEDRPNLLKNLVVGASTYAGFQALDQLVAWGVQIDRLRVHLGHTRESGGNKNPFDRHHPMLHSKIYYMEFPHGQACAFVGSNNLTSFALQGLNGEAAILLEGEANATEFDRVRKHIQAAVNQAVPYSPGMKEAFAWWTREFLEGLRSEIAIPTGWTTIRTILIFATAAPGDRPNIGEHLYFELPEGIAIDSLKTEAHLFLFNTLPESPWQALDQTANAQAHYTCKVLGAENRQGNRELIAQWQIESSSTPRLRQVPSGVLRPTPPPEMQQIRVEVDAHFVTAYDYQFERERLTWWPLFSEKGELHPEGVPKDRFPIADVGWRKESHKGWKLVVGLKQGEGAAVEKDAEALELAKPESGAFILVSVRRRPSDRAH